jgi:hypothetical protein
MRSSTRLWSLTSVRLWVALVLLVMVARVALAQVGGAPTPRPRVKMEYVHQEVQADAVVQTLNDLDGQGWNIFQIVPTWQLKNENSEGALVPKTYQVFGRRPAGEGK